MEIRDVVHGAIPIETDELPVVDSRYFQRLRQIKQLGFAEHSFPSATHNRYIHSLGAMHTASTVFRSIFRPATLRRLGIAEKKVHRFRSALRFAALLHDVGHGPLSHTTEFAMPDVRELKLPGDLGKKSRKADHEDYTLKILLDSPLTEKLDRAGRPHGFSAHHIAALINPELKITDDFFDESVQGEKISFRTLLQQMVSSEMDADRMDYLRRDSLYCGVSYGQFDFDWLANNLTLHVKSGRAYLCLEHRALYSFEDFLISRFHMFLMVYFHYKSVVFDEMLGRYFSSPDCDYQLPADIEAYCDCNDSHLYSHLAESSNEWARRIVEKTPYRLLVELHSGIPAGKTAENEQKKILTELRKSLKNRGIFWLESTSTGELSKYFGKQKDPIFVRYDNHYSAPAYIPLERCTDLFQKYGEKRSITRLYVSPERYPDCKNLGRGTTFRYEDEAESSRITL